MFPGQSVRQTSDLLAFPELRIEDRNFSFPRGVREFLGATLRAVSGLQGIERRDAKRPNVHSHAERENEGEDYVGST
jgi:hypothetical protein